jgi:hypothetical protein
MFKIVESITTKPIKFPVKPGVKLVPGQVISLVDYGDDLVVDKCDGYAPFGLLGNRCIGGNIVNFKKRANTFPQRMIADLNVFDRDNEINVGNSLYCNKDGVLSSKKPFENSYALAKVITPADKNRKHMQILWL